MLLLLSISVSTFDFPTTRSVRFQLARSIESKVDIAAHIPLNRQNTIAVRGIDRGSYTEGAGLTQKSPIFAETSALMQETTSL